ncbi:MAG: response regulator [Anaerolineae bacterium]|nr:response regulator [Anaerolineae bacterium]
MGAPSQAEVHEALERLGDSVALAQTRLAACFPQLQEITHLNQRAQKLRALLLEAIEALSPTQSAPFGSVASRAYDVLTLRYVERMSAVDMAEELSLSRRQVHRDLKLAEERLAELLGSWAQSGSQEPLTPTEDPLSEELALFSIRSTEVPLRSVVEEALSLVQPLAHGLGVSIHGPDLAAASQQVVGNPAFLRQLATQVLSLAVQSTEDGKVVVDCRTGDDSAVLTVQLLLADPGPLAERLAEVHRMARSQGMACAVSSLPSREVTVSLTFRRGTPIRVLVIEDNPGTVELYRRYLPATEWQVEAAADPRLAHELSKRLKPQVVILDIMMPHVDGWTLLRTLKQSPETRDIPILICSVTNDPALGKALGARVSLVKPISQAELLLALHRCLE